MTKAKRSGKRWVRDLVLLIGIAGIALMITAVLLRATARNVEKDDILQIVERAAADYQRTVRLVEGSLMAVRDYGADPEDPEAAGHYFMSTVFPGIEKLSGISLTGQGGNAFYFTRESVRNVREEGGYNPEERPWFEGAVSSPAPDQCFWTDIYPFHTSGKDGITISLGWKGGNDRYVVAAYDILLGDFFKAVRQLPRRDSSLAFIFEEDETLYIPDADDAELRLARRGYEVWKNPVRRADSGSEMRIEPIRIDRDAWWCGFFELEKSKPNPVWICVMVPQSKLMGANNTLLYVGIMAIVLASIAAIYLAFFMKRATSGFEEVPEPDRILDLIGKGENRAVEFKSTMRMNLHSKKPGKEIEQAWLKGVAAFLNTEGGTLLLGVTDAGEISGLEQDVFENDDKCRLHFKNLIAKALGADVSKFIRFTMVGMEGKTIGVVQCIPASRPVYLRDGNKETFYIRNGPSSDELPPSRMVHYIAERWK